MGAVDRILRLLLRPTRFVWHRLPQRVLDTRPMRRLGALFYDHCVRDSERVQAHFTCFLRNRPQLEVLRDLLAERPAGATVRMASLGCSAGQELYSALWMVRRARPDLRLVAVGVDLSEPELRLARRAVYDPAKPQDEGGVYTFAGPRILAATSEPLPGLLEPAAEGGVRVCDWLREGVSFRTGNACDPGLVAALGPQDVVLACNFLGPMHDPEAAACVGNIVRLLASGALLVLDGMDLDLKGRVLPELGLEPITDRIEEVHRADPSKRDWPWTRWSLEPMDRNRADWAMRYATLFRGPA